MESDEFRVGLVSYGLYLPEKFETAEEIARRSGLSRDEVVFELGIERKCLPSKEDQPGVMAAKAARQAFERSGGVPPEEVDVVIWTGEEYKDYIAQTAGIRLQEEVGARNAWAFDLTGQGVTFLVGLRVARDLMMGDPSVQIVLLAGGTRNIDLVNYSNPDTRWMLATSAGGAALLLRRGHPCHHLLATAFLVDSEMADEVYVPGGGTVQPFSPENLGTEAMFFRVADPNKMDHYLAGRLSLRFITLIREVMEKGGFPGEPPDYLALRHLQPAVRARILEGLGLPEESTDALADIGHHGPNDVMISLDRGLRREGVKDGSKVVLAEAGIGFTYAAALIQWGPS
jgi:3-oxoacyl-[acyl-carrier-protein] synthase-3